MMYFKVTNEEEVEDGIQYKDGLNDLSFFNKRTTIDNESSIRLYYKDCFWIREAKVNNSDIETDEHARLRTSKVILEERHCLKELSTWKWLLDCGVVIDAHLLWFVIYNDLIDILKYLTKDLQEGRLLNELLVYASSYGRLDIAKYLISNGADVTYRSNSSVVYAAENGHLEMIKLLKNNGACLNDMNNQAMYHSIDNKRIDIVKYLFENGCHITIDSEVNFQFLYKVIEAIDPDNNVIDLDDDENI